MAKCTGLFLSVYCLALVLYVHVLARKLDKYSLNFVFFVRLPCVFTD